MTKGTSRLPILNVTKNNNKSKNISQRWMRSQKAPPSDGLAIPFLGSSFSKGSADGNIGNAVSFNCNSPIFKRLKQTAAIDVESAPVIDARVIGVENSRKRKRAVGDPIDEVMKTFKTDDEVTKRLLMVVHYMNQQPDLREMIVDANTGVVTFGKFL